ncbi:MAG: O-antigen ligase family protein [Acidobacteria bacterium]|nr:O-antigen ligase family protein [Acidobacteriota bacterium]
MRPGSDIIPSIGTAAGVALCACVVVVPLFGGGATPLGIMVVRLSALAVFLLCLLGRRATRGFEGLGQPLAALVLLALFGLLQSFAWPRGLVEMVSPEHLGFADEAARALGDEPPSRVSLSLYAPASRRVALDCLVFASLAITAFWVGRRRSRRLWLAGAIVFTAGLQFVLGLRPWLGGQVPRLRATYANPDHLCILLEIAACVAFGGIFWALSTRRWRDQGARRAVGALIAGTLLLLMLSAIAFTGSRAGILAALVGLAVLAVAANRKSRWVSVALVGGVSLGSVSFLAWIGVGRSFGRLAATSWFEVAWGSRAMVWWESLGLMRRFPIAGSGLGTFESAFPLVQPASLEGMRWAKAHNDFLELMVTGGLVGFAIAVGGTVLLLLVLTRKLRAAFRTEDRLALAVALGSLAAVATHETFDFGLSLPANAFILITIVAAALGARTETRG